ncbi:MAG: hypothetical protein IPM64_10855 [Phycisphaerales bacterium]|nr:hypothetical protein [Phycisphaerales bacterium]
MFLDEDTLALARDHRPDLGEVVTWPSSSDWHTPRFVLGARQCRWAARLSDSRIAFEAYDSEANERFIEIWNPREGLIRRIGPGLFPVRWSESEVLYVMLSQHKRLEHLMIADAATGNTKRIGRWPQYCIARFPGTDEVVVLREVPVLSAGGQKQPFVGGSKAAT